MFSKPDVPAVTPPTEYAQQQAPDNAAVQQAARRTTDNTKSAASTILTSPTGVGTNAGTTKKTLLGS
jgi:hypothetical protein